MTSRSHNKMF